MEFQLRLFGEGSPTPARDLAQLHAALLPASPIARLGRIFAQHFYYRRLPKHGLIFGAVAYVDGCPVGFVSATDDSDGFLRRGLRAEWTALAWALPASLLAHPAGLKALWQTRRLMKERDSAAIAGGELLSIGVLPEFRTRDMKERLGVSPAEELLRAVTDRFGAGGIRRAVLYLDRGNTHAAHFYTRHGWTLGRLVEAGWPSPQLEFHWQPPAPAPARSAPRAESRPERSGSRLGRELASLHKSVGEAPGHVGTRRANPLERLT